MTEAGTTPRHSYISRHELLTPSRADRHSLYRKIVPQHKNINHHENHDRPDAPGGGGGFNFP